MIGRLSKGFVAEVDRYNDVWNQPVSAYESEIVGDVPVTGLELSQGISRKLRVKTKMTYGDELEFYTPELASEGVLGFVSKDPVTGTQAQTNGEKHYEYVLELDSLNRIVGGEWISVTRPDFIWSKTKDTQFSSTPGNGSGIIYGFINLFRTKFPLAGLQQIYKPVRR